MAEGHDSLSGFQKVLTAAPGAVTPMDMQELHEVAHKLKRRVPFDNTALQKHGGNSFGQSFVTELIQLVPLTMVEPFLLISFGRSLGN